MSYAAVCRAVALRDRSLRTTGKALLIALASYADAKTDELWIQRARIQEHLNMDLKTISNCTQELVAKGYLVHTGRFKKRQPIYRLDLPWSSENGIPRDPKTGFNGAVPNRTREGNETLAPSQPALLVALPSGVPEQAWQQYLLMRKANKKPATEYAQSIILARLARWHKEGVDVGAALEASILNCWTDVYDPRERKGNGRSAGRPQSPSEISRGAI
jgi:hypothetical protein